MKHCIPYLKAGIGLGLVIGIAIILGGVFFVE